MKKILCAGILHLLFLHQLQAQSDRDCVVATLQNADQILDEFAQSAHNNLSFQNGRWILIPRPRNNKDALRKAFKVVHRDNETYRDLEIIGAKNLVIEYAVYRAVLCRHKKTGRSEIVLYRKLQDGCYYLSFQPLQY